MPVRLSTSDEMFMFDMALDENMRWSAADFHLLANHSGAELWQAVLWHAWNYQF